MKPLVFAAFFPAWFIQLAMLHATPSASPPVDPGDRDDVVRYFHEAYLSSEDYAAHHGWTGSVASCDAGSLSAEFQDDVIRRINYFRAMAGLPAEITLSATLNAKCQEAALMMASNNALNHFPPTTWSCYTDGGAEAASQSNLSLGENTPFYGPAAVTGQLADDGDSNAPVIHRRWILYTRAPDEMGHGSIPLSPIVSKPSADNTTMALWVSGASTSVLTDDFQFVAWPPAGCVPSSLAYQRWSFGLPDDSTSSPDFSAATVTMTRDGTTVPLTIVYRANSPTAADPTIVWEPAGFPLAAPPAEDMTYTVTVAGVIGAPQESYSYEVTVINEYAITPIELAGSDNAYIGYDNIYNFEPVTGAQAYELRVAATADGDWTEGAETSPAPQVIDATSSRYPYTVTALKAEGARSFHLLEPEDTIEIDREILPTAASRLTFSQRFRYVGTGMYLLVEVEASPGNWVEVWRRKGRAGSSAGQSSWDSTWSSESVPLGDYAGGTVRVRFRYIYVSGPKWTANGDPPNEFGAFVDSVRVSDSSELLGESFVEIDGSATSVAFQPDETGEFWLQMRPKVAETWFGFGSEAIVSAIIGSPPSMLLTATGIDATGRFFIEVEATGYAAFAVSASTDGGALWNTDESFTASQPTPGTHRFTASVTGAAKIFRVTASE